ncbi:dynamin GTPase [Astrocystis sublimbata]|nr:dynamin GTPase [Astrocystis sublimbata]
MADIQSSLMQPTLLEKIDGLFACNAGHYVNLPQLVVVGHQSSGKSSVLQGLTDLPFPRDSGLCTRFATQIIFRRASAESIVAFIIPSKDASTEHQDHMKEWRQELDVLTSTSFAGIMSEVASVMGVTSTDGQIPQNTFSKDVLVLEIAGPMQEHFSVIDVPGTFKKTTEGVTTKADIALVDDMVRSYMSNPRSVMLTVVASNIDIATQEIVEQAEDLDPEGIRTLGVLTKPDLVDKGGEDNVIQLIEGKRHRLKLGWHVVRNLGQAELDNQAVSRSAQENAFFATQSPWNSLDKDKVGVVSLRCRLQEILAAHIRREFPKVRLEVNQKIKKVQKQLSNMGPKRQTREQQATYLMEIAQQFQSTSAAAARADYGQSTFFKDRVLRLATRAIDRGDEFARLMSASGHNFKFDNSDEKQDIADVEDFDVDMEDESPEQPLASNVRTVPNHADVQDIMHNASIRRLAPREDDILIWLKFVYRQSRGFEIGTFDGRILSVTMQEQATKWYDLALGYISDIIAMVHSFVARLLENIVSIGRVRQGIMALLMDDLRVKYQAALEHTKFLLRVELEGLPATVNHYFNENLTKCRQQRLRRQLQPKVLTDCQHGEVVRLDDITRSQPIGNVDHVIFEIHDILRSYYKVALKRFVDNVRMQVADHLLVAGPKTPLQLFDPAFVTKLTDAHLEDVAGEEPNVRRKRAALEKELQLLKQGKKILQ